MCAGCAKKADEEKATLKAMRVPVNPRREIADRAFYAAPMLRHVEIAAGTQHVGFAAWQSCQQLQIVKLPPLSPKLRRWSFPRLLCPSGGCPGLHRPQLFEFCFCGQQILHLPFRRWTRTSECFAEFTAPVSPVFMPSWHFELLYRLLPFRLFLGLVCFVVWGVVCVVAFSVRSQPGW